MQIEITCDYDITMQSQYLLQEFGYVIQKHGICAFVGLIVGWMVYLYQSDHSIADATFPYHMFKTSVNSLGYCLDGNGLFVDKC